VGLGTDSGARVRRSDAADDVCVWRLGPELAVKTRSGSSLVQAIDEVFGLFAASTIDQEERTISLELKRGDRGALRLYVDNVPIVRIADETALSPAIEATLVGFAVRSRKGMAAFHAAGVEIDGRGVLLLGSKGSGKSTLSYQLAVEGARYLGDEIAFVRFLDRGLEAFPKAVTLKQAGFHLFPRTPVHNDPIRGPVRYLRPPNVPLDPEWSTTIGVLILPRWSADVEQVEVTELAPGEAALELVKQSFGGLDRDPRALSLIARLSRVPAYRMVYPDVASGAAAVLHLTRRAERE
jgi:hypothetical protein